MNLKRFYRALTIIFLLMTTICNEAYGFWWTEDENEKALNNSRAIEASVKVFGQSWAKKNQGVFLGSSCGAIVDMTCGWDISVMTNQKLTIDEARPVIVKAIEGFLQLIYSNSGFQNDVVDMRKRYPRWTIGDVAPDKIGIKLAFWDENVDRPLPPYLAQVRVVGGKILYFEANAHDQSLREPPYSETIEEAFAKIGYPLPQPY